MTDLRKLPLVQIAAFGNKGSEPPFAAPSTKVCTGPKASIELIGVKVRLVRVADVGVNRSEWPAPALQVEMCSVQQLGRYTPITIENGHCGP